MSSEMDYSHDAMVVDNALRNLQRAAFSMSNIGSQSNPYQGCINFIAQRNLRNPGCHTCYLSGHGPPPSLQCAAMCRAAILSSVVFWEKVLDDMELLYKMSDTFVETVTELHRELNVTGKDLVLGLPTPGLYGTPKIIVNHLAANSIKLRRYLATHALKLSVILNDDDKMRLQNLFRDLEHFFLNGVTYEELVFQYAESR